MFARWKLTICVMLSCVVSNALTENAFGNDAPVRRPRPQLFELRFPSNESVQTGRPRTTLTVTYTGTAPTSTNPGASVMPNIQVQGVYLGSAFGTGKSNASDVAFFDGFLSYLVGNTSPYMKVLAPYGVSTGTAAPGKVFTGTLPHYTRTNRVYLTDTQIQNILIANISSLIAPSPNTLYVVYTEPGVAIDAGGGATSINTFLGYHNYAKYTAGGVTNSFAYAVMPYPGSPNPSSSSQGFANARDELTSVTSHEIGEAATDADTMNGWLETVIETDTYKNSSGKVIAQYTYYYTGEEIGDVPLILYKWSPSCFVRLNGYLVQKMISPDGKTMLTYPASSPMAGSIPELIVPASLHVAEQALQFLGFNQP